MKRRIAVILVSSLLLGFFALVWRKSYQRPQCMMFDSGGMSHVACWIMRGRIGFDVYIADLSMPENPHVRRGKDWFDPRQPDPPPFGGSWESGPRPATHDVEF
jgi:hypothetical protein